MNITKNQLSMVLSPKYSPIKSNANLLCETLGVPFDEIVQTEQMELDLDDNTTNDRFVEVRDIKPVKTFNGIELFAGAGGLALGLEMAGFETVGAVEIDKYACKTLRKNRPNWKVIEEDIVEVAERGIKKLY